MVTSPADRSAVYQEFCVKLSDAQLSFVGYPVAFDHEQRVVART